MKSTLCIVSVVTFLASLTAGGSVPEILQENEQCFVIFNPTNKKYDPHEFACGIANDGKSKLDCNYHLVDDGHTTDPIPGICEMAKCMGSNSHDPPKEGTRRITICHRTCSRTNPWVRITIDENGYNDMNTTGCGHGLEHDIWEDCKATQDELNSIWGGKSYDYEIKRHGTRDDVRRQIEIDNGLPDGTVGPNHELERAYWKIWEKACPYVRNGQCCSFEDGTCCGASNSTDGGGDPHFRRWGQQHDSFHGECDLVLAHSDSFLNGEGIDFHIRTTIQGYFSYIETAAVRVGDKIMEFYHDHFYVNGIKLLLADLPITLGEEVKVTISNYVEEGKLSTNHQNYQIHMGGSSSILLKFYKHYLTYSISGEARDWGDSVGLMGNYHTGDMVARDGEVLDNFEEYAFEWQVNPSDAKLFHQARSPQLPYERCRLPTAERPVRRLRATQKDLHEAAEKACAHASSVKLCVEDVLMTNDIGFAEAW